jgi:D-alanine-D-alanine ligase
LRLTEAGEVYVIEVNASCYLEKESEFAVAAVAAGMDYSTLINRIVELAVERRKISSRDPKHRRRGGRRKPSARQKKLQSATV